MLVTNALEAIEAVRQRYPELAWYGFGMAPWSQEPFEMHRAAMTESGEVVQFLRGVEWLAQVEQTARINRRRHSYDWKHVAERWHMCKRRGNYYIAEGMFIAAAVHLGFQIQRMPNTTSVWLNIPTACDNEPPRVCRRLFGLSHAAMAG